MSVEKIGNVGTTKLRKAFWDDCVKFVESSRKKAGRNVSVNEYQGYGTIINVDRKGAGGPVGACCIGEECSIRSQADCEARSGTYQGDGTTCDPNPCTTPDCTSCDDLQTTNPSGVPVHINIVRTVSGGCGDLEFSGSITYDADLSFSISGTGGSCDHGIPNNDGGTAWSGGFTKLCTLDENTVPFGLFGGGGEFSRKTSDCTWWISLSNFPLLQALDGSLGSCDACSPPFDTILVGPNQQIAGAGDPTGTYTITQTENGVTITTVITIT